MNDKLLNISTANSRRSKYWPQTQMYWSEFVKKLESPTRTAETYENYMAYKKSDQDELKDIGGFVGGVLKNGIRKSGHVVSRDLITLDLDNIPAGEAELIEKKLNTFNCAYVIYSTRKHSTYRPRLRVILPTDRSMTADEYEPIARKLADLIGMYYADPTTFQNERLMYWPSASKDSEYFYRVKDAGFLQADSVLRMYKNWRDINEWPIVPGQAKEDHLKLAQKQGEPTEKPGVVGAFCKTYNIIEAIDKFIPNSYEPTDIPDRYTYVGGSTAGGAVIYEDGKFLYSHHATDPCSGKLVNAFDLVRLHLYGDLDNDAKVGTPVNSLPSNKEMTKFALQDVSVRTLINAERMERTREEFNLPIDAPVDWMNELTTNPNTGKFDNTINNVVKILRYDPNLSKKIVLDEFANRGIVMGELPWNPSNTKRIWTDVDDAGLRNYIEVTYSITGKERIFDALSLVTYENRLDDVKKYLNSLIWDGVSRIDTLFRDYLGCEDNKYTRAVSRKSLCAAVARAIVPGIKWDYMPILTGPQGIGKSTFLAILGKDWFSDSLNTFEGKEASEMIQGTWINEIGELNGLNKSETNAVKQFLSKREDIYRVPYGRRTEIFKRRCVFFGTSNDNEYLKDKTGNRRFWPIDVGVHERSKSVFEDLPGEVDQVWAEAVAVWRLGEPLYLDKEIEALAFLEQESHTESNLKEGLILEYLEKEIPVNWNDLNIDSKKSYFNSTFTYQGETMKRNSVSAVEIWSECFGQDPGKIKRIEAMEINNILTGLKGWTREKSPRRLKYYGQQKCFIRK